MSRFPGKKPNRPLDFMVPTSREIPRSGRMKLEPLRDDRGNLIGHVDPVYGRLYTKNKTLSRPVVALRVSRGHLQRRKAALDLGYGPGPDVAAWEERQYRSIQAGEKNS